MDVNENTIDAFVDADLDWYQAHLRELQEHRGEWTAISQARAVAFAPDLEALLDEVDRLDLRDPLIIRIESDDRVYTIA